LGDCDSGKRPDDVLLPSWSQNRDFAIDVAITDPICGTFKLDMEACNKYADKYKHDKYDDGFKNTQIDFVPVVFSTFGSLNEEGLNFFKDLFRRNCDSLDKLRCTNITLLWQKLSILLQKENFKMMSRRFKLSYEHGNSKPEGIPEVNGENDGLDELQTHQHQILDDYLTERKEDSIQNQLSSSIPEVLESTTNGLQQELQVEVIPQLLIENALQEDIVDISTKYNFNKEEIKKEEESDSDFDQMPKKGDRVKVKYPDDWYIGRVTSSKKNYFWVEFKGFDELFKVRKEEKFKII
jgi:hypothetical protein